MPLFGDFPSIRDVSDNGILIRAGYFGFDFWQSMGPLLLPKTTSSRGGLTNKDAHRCPR